ncbi:MAG: HTH domain-containing protein [Candidatus Coproplasma sp.]
MSLKSEILKRLDSRRGEYVSGESLSQSLGVTRQAVWKAVKKLTQEGYIIASVTNRGYMLDGKCDLLSSAVIADKTGASVYCYDEVTSTNTVAMQRLCTDGECIVVAERQTMGRTKSGASFASPEQKGVYMSVALKCSLPLDRADELRAKCAKAVAEVIGDCCGNIPEIQNVDELFLNDKKVCGILVEGEVNLAAKTINSVIIGIGVYTAEVEQTLGYITASEPRNALICNIYGAIKEIVKYV